MSHLLNCADILAVARKRLIDRSFLVATIPTITADEFETHQYRFLDEYAVIAKQESNWEDVRLQRLLVDAVHEFGVNHEQVVNYVRTWIQSLRETSLALHFHFEYNEHPHREKNDRLRVQAEYLVRVYRSEIRPRMLAALAAAGYQIPDDVLNRANHLAESPQCPFPGNSQLLEWHSWQARKLVRPTEPSTAAQPTASEQQAHTPNPLHRCNGLLLCSADFTVITRLSDMKVFRFTDSQRHVMRYMVEQFELSINEHAAQTLLEKADSESDSLYNVFRSRGKSNPAWGDLIRTSGKGRYKLNAETEKTEARSKPAQSPR